MEAHAFNCSIFNCSSGGSSESYRSFIVHIRGPIIVVVHERKEIAWGRRLHFRHQDHGVVIAQGSIYL